MTYAFRRTAVCWLLVFWCFAFKGVAQSPGPIIELFTSLEKTHGVVFSYNPRLLNALRFGPIDLPDDLQGTLDRISSILPLRFDRTDEENILVIPVRNPVQFEVFDAADNTPLELIYIKVNNSTPRYLLPNNGAYLVDDLFITDSLLINSSFYQAKTLMVGQLDATNGKIMLNPDTVNLEDVVIQSYLTSGVNSVLGDHRIEINMSDLGLIAGETDGDVYQVLQAIPGIQSPSGRPGNLNIRGSQFNQNLTLFDNIPIYHTGHFFGSFSPYNPAMVETMNVYRAGQSAQWGGRIGGVIEMKTRETVPESVSVGALVNTIYGGMELELPVISDKLGAIFSARHKLSFTDDLPPKLDAFYDLTFQGSALSKDRMQPSDRLDELNIGFTDWNAKLIYQLNPKNRISLSALNIQNDFDYVLVMGADQGRIQQEDTQLENWGVTGEWSSSLTDQIELSASFTSSSFLLRELRKESEGGVEQLDQTTTNELDNQIAGVKVKYQPTARVHVDLGYQYTSHDILFTQTREGSNRGPRRRENEGSVQAVYLSFNQQVNNRINATLGFRADFFTARGNEQIFLQPRLSLTYLFSRYLYAKASFNRSHQYIWQTFVNDFDDFRVDNQFWRLSDRDFPVQSATNYMLGILYDRGSWLIDAEFYSRTMDDLSRRGQGGGPPGTPPAPTAFGEVMVEGVDLMIKKRWIGFESWISYSLAFAKENLTVEQDVFYDQRHVINAKALIPYGRWSFAIGWGLMSGLPVYLPEISREPIEIPYTDRFPSQHQLDLSASYHYIPPSTKWNAIVGLSILNVYDRENVINAFQNQINFEQPLRRGLGFSPNLQLKIIF